MAGPGAAATRRLRIALTCGEPAGVGPEVALKALAGGLPEAVEPVLVGHRAAWERAARLIGMDDPGGRWCLEDPGPAGPVDWDWGRPTPRSAEVAARAVEAAVALALEGRVDALVTAPLTKAGLRAAGRPFPGHTEMLGALCGARPVMMLAGPRLRVALVTTHLPLARVPGAVTRDRVEAVLRAVHRGLQEDFGIHRPRIAVAGLNPHAGEAGTLGREESERIAPAVQAARADGLHVTGPCPADTVFHQAAAGAYDAVVAMYHDQGLGPLKLLHFDDAVNVTLGLPIVRTSPDHGTAFEIAGRGVARASSFRAALATAAAVARRRAGRSDPGPIRGTNPP